MDSEDNTLTGDDVLVANQQDEFNTKCTYSKGYLKRQPLYACLTCNSGQSHQKAAICLACSLHCHEGHELIELCTKRNIRCDCGNSKFPKLECKLTKKKDNVNDLNKYNQNYEGKFCSCHSPYMHPDNQVEDDMIQCVLCEDWYHVCHLEETLDANTEFEGEMICKQCMDKNSFLYNYDQFTIQSGFNEESIPATKTNKCTMPARLKGFKRCNKYWPPSWRNLLCKCSKCMKMYKAQNVLFLLDEEDTLDFYENADSFQIPLDLETIMDKDAYDIGMSMLLTFDRVPMLNVIEAYEDMKKHLFNYLSKFATNNKIVREEDIREFFEEFTSNKKRRLN